jgi:hypothetical protein
MFKKKYFNYFCCLLLFIILLWGLFVIYKNINPVPDLEFFYSDDNRVSTYSKINFGKSELLNISGNITDTSLNNQNSNIIGFVTQYKLCYPTKNNSAYVTNIETYHLKNGSILIQPAGIQPKNSQGNYTISSKSTQSFSIINGTDSYFNVKGKVILNTNANNLERKVSIYFY